MDLLDQYPDRSHRHSVGVQSRSGKLWTAHCYRHHRGRTGDGRCPRDGVGAHARQQCRLDQPRGHCSAGGRLPAGRRLRRTGAARAPMLPMRLFCSRAFSSGNTASFLYSASLYGTLFFMAQFLQTALGHGPLGAGLRLLPWTATLFVVAPVAGALVNRIGERSLIVFGLVLQAIGMAWIAMVAAPDLAYATLVAPLNVA